MIFKHKPEKSVGGGGLKGQFPLFHAHLDKPVHTTLSSHHWVSLTHALESLVKDTQTCKPVASLRHSCTRKHSHSHIEVALINRHTSNLNKFRVTFCLLTFCYIWACTDMQDTHTLAQLSSFTTVSIIIIAYNWQPDVSNHKVGRQD